ncbi:phage portal protein [Microbacterium sorbitolivorans]|uniref:Phage portal protein n=1 Tax=Microbacterium sorbitolivorans TaxID=1867410 RepID=A0A367Y736_9MICO|nr:phage portal protein [Microbacterium sorbitolivorans]RCK61676.1 phage portal protein [Microbacterium sorbitolivorans]GGF30161.1 phage portal protein [Microbacterium sorbitolivorans]
MGFREWWTGEQHRAEADAPDVVPPSDPSTAITAPSRDEIGSRGVASREALGLGAVFRAVDIRATALRQISFDQKRGGLILEDRPRILDKPDPLASRRAFIEMTGVSLDLTGNAYWRLGYAPGAIKGIDKPVTAEVLNPNDVLIDTNSAGNVTGYRHRGKQLGVYDVKHLARLRIPGTPYGLGPIQAAQVELRGSLDVAKYGSEFIYNGDVPSGTLKSDQRLSKEQADDARTQWEQSRGGKRSVAVLGAGLDYKPIFLSPKDAQFVESQQWSVTTVARIFGAPRSLMLVTDGDSQTYQNVEQDWLGFVRFGLAGVLTEIEDALTDLLPRGSEAVSNTAALLKTDTKTRYETHNLALAGRWRTRREIREIEGLSPEPVGGWDDEPASEPEEVTA